MDTLQTESTPENHTLIITDVRFRTNSTQLATSSFDRTVRLWDASDVMIFILAHFYSCVNSFHFIIHFLYEYTFHCCSCSQAIACTLLTNTIHMWCLWIFIQRRRIFYARVMETVKYGFGVLILITVHGFQRLDSTTKIILFIASGCSVIFYCKIINTGWHCTSQVPTQTWTVSCCSGR